MLDVGDEPNREEIMIAFVKKLAKKMRYKPFALYMDQLAVHRRKTVRAQY